MKEKIIIQWFYIDYIRSILLARKLELWYLTINNIKVIKEKFWSKSNEIKSIKIEVLWKLFYPEILILYLYKNTYKKILAKE